MRASPGSRVEPADGGRDSSAAAIRRDASTNCRVAGTPVTEGRMRGVSAAGGAGGGGAYGAEVEGASRPQAGAVKHLVAELGKVGQRAGARTLGSVHRLPNLVPPPLDGPRRTPYPLKYTH